MCVFNCCFELKDVITWSVQLLAIALVPFLAYRFGLKGEREKHRRHVEELTSALDLKVVSQEGQGITVRVANPTDYPLHKAIAIITVDYKKEDVLEPIEFETWIDGGSLCPLVEDRLSWSARIDGSNPYSIDILAQEELSLSLFRFVAKYTHRAKDREDYIFGGLPRQSVEQRTFQMIVVASEEGFGSLDNVNSTKKARVALDRKSYKFWIKIVSEDTRGKVWECEYIDGDPLPVKVHKVISAAELRKIQSEIRKNF